MGILKQVKVKFKKENKEVCNLWAALKSPFDHHLLKNFLKQTTKAISVQLFHSPSKTFVISPTSRLGFPDDFIKNQSPTLYSIFWKFDLEGVQKKGEENIKGE